MYTWKNKLLEHFAPQLLILLVILILILNSALVMGVQLAVDFPLQNPQEPFAAEGEWEILDVHSTGRVNGYIIWQNHQQWRLIITERHFHTNRWRTVCDAILMEQDFEEEFRTSYGRIMVRLHGYADFDQFNWISTPIFRTLHVPGDFLLWNGALLLVEILAWIIFRKLRGH